MDHLSPRNGRLKFQSRIEGDLIISDRLLFLGPKFSNQDPSIRLCNFNRPFLGLRRSIFEADNATEITSTSSTT
jgi:hypothetical protein